MTKRLVVASSSTPSEHVNERNAMATLAEAAKEARESNLKNSLTHLVRGFKESDSNDGLFLSKLMELDFQDLEMLYVAFCGPEKKRKISKKGSGRKRSSVVNSSFANEAFEMEIFPGEHLCGKSNKKNSITKEEREISLICLCKAYSLQKELRITDHKEQIITKVLNIHLKVENYSACTLLLSENTNKCINTIILALSDDQKLGIFDNCMKKVSQTFLEDIIKDSTDAARCISYCSLASKLLPSRVKPHETICKIYKQRNEAARAIDIARNFLNHVDSKNECMMLLLLLCEIDEGRPLKVLSQFENMEQNGLILSKYFIATRGLLLILCDDAEEGIKMLTDMNISEENETVCGVFKLMNTKTLLNIAEKAKCYIEENLMKNKHNLNETMQAQIKEEKTFLKLITQTLMKSDLPDLSLDKLYTDCLLICDEFGMVESYLATQIRQHEGQILPIIYLANARLKMGAYNAACEDFMKLKNIAGEHELMQSLLLLPGHERMEIARVHRLRAFRYLEKEFAFKEGAECFSIAICAAGRAAIGLVLTRGYCYMHLNNYEKASKDFDYCVRNDASAPALCARAVLYAVTTHIEESIVDFRKAFASDINACFQSIIKLPLDHVLLFSQLVAQYVKQEIERVKNIRMSQYSKTEDNIFDHRYRSPGIAFNIEVLKYSEFLCNLFPEDIDYCLTQVVCLFFAYGNSAALSEVTRAIGKYPNEHRLTIWKGILLICLQKFNDALAEFRRLTTTDDVTDLLSYVDNPLKKTFLDVLLRQAKSSAGRECYDESLKLYNIALLFSKKDIASLRGRMECYYQIGDIKNWLEDLNETMKLEPTSKDACMRAQYYLSKSMDINACEDFIMALKLNEQNTIDIVTENLSIDAVTKLFHNMVIQLVEMKIVTDVNKYCEAGLKFNPDDKRLKQLKEKTCLDSHKCILQ